MHKTYGAADLARETGLNVTAVRDRLNKGQTPDQIREVAFTQSQKTVVQGKHKTEKGASAASIKSGYVPAKRRGAATISKSAQTSASEPEPEFVFKPRPRTGAGKPGVGPKKKENLFDAELREKIAKADGIEFKNKINAGLYLPRVQVNRYIGDMYVKARDIVIRIEDLGDKLAGEDDPAVCRRLLREEAVRALECLRVIAAGEAEVEEGGEEAA